MVFDHWEEGLSSTLHVDPAVDDSRLNILHQAALCFEQRGYAATSIDDVARGLRSTKGRVYHHFYSKAALFAAVFERGMEINFAAIQPAVEIEGSALQRFEEMARVHITTMLETRPFQRVVWEGVEMLMRGALTPEQRQDLSALQSERKRYSGLFRKQMSAAREAGDMSFDDLSVATQIMFTTVNSPIFWYRERADQTSEERREVVEQILRFALRGLGAPGRTTA